MKINMFDTHYNHEISVLLLMCCCLVDEAGGEKSIRDVFPSSVSYSVIVMVVSLGPIRQHGIIVNPKPLATLNP
jgi:hypothetical protein